MELVIKDFTLPAVPQEGILEKVETAEIYAYLPTFLQTSVTFASYWRASMETPRAGVFCEWNNIADNSMLMAQSFCRLLKQDRDWYFRRCPNVSQETLRRLFDNAEQIVRNPVAEKLFYLMIYARDYGWVDTKTGQGHQPAGVPILEKIMEELDIFDFETIAICKKWIEFHSMPAETFLGEVSPCSLEKVLDVLAKDHHVNYKQMFALLSYLELNCIRPNLSASYDLNTSMICDLAEKSPAEIIQQVKDTRLMRILFAQMRVATTTPDEHERIEVATLQRLDEVSTFIQKLPADDQAKITRLLNEVDLHYVAATFPKMSALAVARVLHISAKLCFATEKPAFLHITNAGPDRPVQWDKLMLNQECDDEYIAKAHTSINSIGYLEWNPPL